MTKHPKEADRLKKIVEAFPKLTVTVLGDLVADEFVFGEISRVSREAPVLILKHRERTVVPGGGANAANNLADLGVNVLPVGIVGDDEPGRMLLKYFRHKRIAVSGVLEGQELYHGHEDAHPCRHDAHGAAAGSARRPRAAGSAERASDARAVSGGAELRACLRRAAGFRLWLRRGHSGDRETLCRKRASWGRCPSSLDSRYRMLQYSGMTAATPNEPEVEEALGIRIGQDWNKVIAAGDQVMAQMKLQSLVITRGRDGMVAFDQKHKPVDIPIFGSDQVADVTGAGDTVIASFTAALAAGATTEEAAQLANYAGGIVVMKRGTATVSREELLHAIEQIAPGDTTSLSLRD